MAPCHPRVSPRVPLRLRSWPWCESPQPSCLATGVRKKGEGHLILLHAGEMPAAGRLCTGEPWSLPGKVLLTLAQLPTPKEVILLAANTMNHYFEIESCCHSESGSKPQGWLAGSSPAMQRCFHSINKYHSASFPPLEGFFFPHFSLFEYFSYFSSNSFTLFLPQLHGGFCLQCSHRYSQHIF